MWKLLALTTIILGALAAEEPKPQYNSKANETKAPAKNPYPQAGAKNETAYGRYHGSYDRRDYDNMPSYGDGHKIFRSFNAPLIDDYICDLDATILVVTNSDSANMLGAGNDNTVAAQAQDAGFVAGNDNNYARTKRDAYGPPEYGPERDGYGPRDYPPPRNYPPPRDFYGKNGYDGHGPYPPFHGYGHHYDFGYGPQYGYGPGIVANADRLRCSIIAGNDQDACTTCCRLSARRDRSISKDKIVGWLVDNNQLNYDSQTVGGEGFGDNYAQSRKKRSNIYVPPVGAVPPVATNPQVAAPTVAVSAVEGDYRCVCCAPKRYQPFLFDRYFSRYGHRYPHGKYD